jgi:hypothetical protein
VVLKAKVADMTSGEHDYLGEMTMFRNCSLTGMSFGLVQAKLDGISSDR